MPAAGHIRRGHLPQQRPRPHPRFPLAQIAIQIPAGRRSHGPMEAEKGIVSDSVAREVTDGKGRWIPGEVDPGLVLRVICEQF